MAIKPEGSLITFGGAIIADTVLAVEDVAYSTEVQFFERVEFSHERLKQAPEISGAQPVFIQLAGGRPAQLMDSCVEATARSLDPDDDVYDDIYRRFDIKRWTITGTAAGFWTFDLLITSVAIPHKVLLNRFEAHLAKGKANISIDMLIAMQSVDFSYLTSTGFEMEGACLGDDFLPASFDNLLLVQLIPDVDYVEKQDDAYSSNVEKRWQAVIEQRTEVAATSSIF